MKITSGEYKLLWAIENQGQTDPAKASDGSETDIKEKIALFLALDKKKLVKVEIREGDRVYGAVLTDAGREVLKDRKYLNWVPAWDRH